MSKKILQLYAIALVGILIDQTSKILVHQQMALYSEISVLGDWFKLHYVLNSGMAFSLEFKFKYGKLLLMFFRLLAVFGLGYFLYFQHKRGKVRFGFLIFVALILGGAVGNLIDGIFYGVFMEGNVMGDAFTPWFHGRVIDMLYFPLYEGRLPDWIPYWGNAFFIFFSPVFNIADSLIFSGVSGIFLFHRRSIGLL